LLFNQNLGRHPYNLMGMASLFHASYLQMTLIGDYFMCFNFEKFLACDQIWFIYSKLNIDNDQNYKLVENWTHSVLYASNKYLSFISLASDYFWNLWIMVDLYIIMKNPFSSKKKRSRIYYLILVVYAILVVW
jgi:hypothetical protein